MYFLMSVPITTRYEYTLRYLSDMNGNVVANNIKLSGRIEGSTMTNSDIVGGTLTIGSGSSILKAGAQGLYLGNFTFDAAPFRVTPTGELTAKNATLVDAHISGNINMTSGVIEWDKVTSPQYSQISGIKPPIDADSTIAKLPSALGKNYTRIGDTYLYTGTIKADQITAGKISAEYIDTTNLAAQRIYQKDYPANYAQIGGAYGDLQLYYAGQNYFSVYNDVGSVTLRAAGREHLRFSSVTGKTHPLGSWDFSSVTVSGLNGVVAVFG